MTWDGVPWAIDGGQNDATTGRLDRHSNTSGNEGVEFATDCIVKPLDTPGPGVKITDGAVTIVGRENTWQGSYGAHNIGDDTADIAATGSSPRSDLVICRVEDPTVPGAGWQYPVDRKVGPYVFTRVIQGVPNTTKTVTELGESWSAIPLARIDIPANTSVITGSMIKDLRKVTKPRSDIQFFTLQGSWTEADSVGNTADYEEFPNGAEWQVEIPLWATQAVIICSWSGLQYRKSGGQGTSGTDPVDAQGVLRAKLGSVATGDVRYWVRKEIQEWSRNSYTGGGTLNIPAAMRGTTQTLRLEGHGLPKNLGRLEADGGSGITAQIQLREVATTDVPDRSPR